MQKTEEAGHLSQSSPAARGPLRPAPPPGNVIYYMTIHFRLAAARCCLLALAAVCLLPRIAAAHPLHVSHAEADFNSTTGKLEVALKVFADDFEAKLSARTGRRVSFEKTPKAELDARCLAYLAETFTVKSRDGTPQSLAFVGRELNDAENRLWLYFEAPLPGGANGARLRHAVLADEFRDQLNSVLVRDGGREVTLVFFPDRSEKTVAFQR